MFTKAFRILNITSNEKVSGPTLINMDPGTVNTKMLLASYGPCGIQVEDALDTFKLATDEKFINPTGIPKYYVGLTPYQPAF